MRKSIQEKWRKSILDSLISTIIQVGADYNACEADLNRSLHEQDGSIIKQKRIIACTTTGAAMYTSAIQTANPSILLVEEAGEILEPHIFTTLGPNTQQLILIGDHQQLRPKCNYKLSVEFGDGYDLNRPLFERLVLKGFPHVTLTEQHRMRPEISSIIKELTYPHLKDAKSTLKRKDLLGFTQNVLFVNHSVPETDFIQMKELKDNGSKSSKQNEFEAQMILKCVRYLVQQGYGSDDIVVLTPYLGQLKLLRDLLAIDNDPILNDMDKFDLIRAGLLSTD